MNYTSLYYNYFSLFHPKQYFFSVDFAFIDRAMAPYKATYWIMFLSATLGPFTLLIKKLGSKFWYVLLICFLIKIGFYFERFVIFTTSLHRDYLPPNQTSIFFNFPFFETPILLLKGVLYAILTLGIVEIATYYQRNKNTK